MRKVEKLMITAVKAGNTLHRDNTLVTVGDYGFGPITSVMLHYNVIAKIGRRMECITLAGWNTQTTKSRIHALLTSALSMPIRIRTHKGTCQYMDTRQPDIWHDLPDDAWLLYNKRTGSLDLMKELPRTLCLSM